jgi:hypothetical protein
VKTSSRLFGVTVVASLIFLTSGRNLLAQTAPPSDELKISTPGGGPTIADIFLAEPTGAGTEPSALYAPTIPFGPLVAPGGLPGIIPPGLPGASYVILTEPSGEPPDPTELPPVFFPPSTQQVRVSDLLISGSLTGTGTTVVPFIALVSDNNPDLATYVGAIPAAATVSIVPETGALQDLTGFLVPPPVFPAPIGPVDVAVVSAIPEPSTLALVVLGAVPILIARRRLSVR